MIDTRYVQSFYVERSMTDAWYVKLHRERSMIDTRYVQPRG